MKNGTPVLHLQLAGVGSASVDGEMAQIGEVALNGTQKIKYRLLCWKMIFVATLNRGRNHDENPRNHQSPAQDGGEHGHPELPWVRI